MKYTQTYILAFCSAILLLAPTASLALESNSYKLYDDANNVANGAPQTSNSFTLNEAGETWVMKPLTGTNYQIVTAPPAPSSSSASSTSSSVSSVTTGGTSGGGSGGGRGSGAPGRGDTPSAPTEPETPEEPTVPVVEPTQPELPAQVIETKTPSAPSSGGQDSGTRDGMSYGEIVYEDTGEAVCLCPIQEIPEEVHCAPSTVKKLPVPTVFENPVLSLLLLMLAYGLGYVSRSSRPGTAQVAPKKKKTSPKKTKKNHA